MKNGFLGAKQVVKLLIYDFKFFETLSLSQKLYFCGVKKNINRTRYGHTAQ